MSIILNDNIRNDSPKILDNRYSKNGVTPYIDVADANATIPLTYRALGLTVLIGSDEYWYQNGVTDIDLVIKSGGGSINGTLNRIAMFTPNGLSVGDSIIKQSPIITGGFINDNLSTDSLIIGFNINNENGTRNYNIGSDNDFSTSIAGSSDVFITGTFNIITNQVVGAIIHGFSNIFYGILSQGMFVFGNNNSITDTSFSYLIGEQHIIDTSSSISTLGLSNSTFNSTTCILVGGQNVVNNSQGTNVLGNGNILDLNTNSNYVGNNNVGNSKVNVSVLGNNNTTALITGSSFIGNNNQGLIILFNGNGGIGITNPTAKFHIKASGVPTNYVFKIDNSVNVPLFNIGNTGNVGINILLPSSKFHIVGSNTTIGAYTVKVQNSALDELFNVDNAGLIGIGLLNPVHRVQIRNSAFFSVGMQIDGASVSYINLEGSVGGILNFQNAGGALPLQIQGTVGVGGILKVTDNFAVNNFINNVAIFRAANVDTYPNWIMGKQTGSPFESNTRFVIVGHNVASTDYILKLKDGNLLGSVDVFTARNDGHIAMNQLPTSSAGLVAGELWNNAGVVNII